MDGFFDLHSFPVEEMKKKVVLLANFENKVVIPLEKVLNMESEIGMRGTWSPSKVSSTLKGILTKVEETIEALREVATDGSLVDVVEKTIKIPLKSLIDDIDGETVSSPEVEDIIKKLLDTVKKIYQNVNKSLEVKQKIDELEVYKSALTQIIDALYDTKGDDVNGINTLIEYVKKYKSGLTKMIDELEKAKGDVDKITDLMNNLDDDYENINNIEMELLTADMDSFQALSFRPSHPLRRVLERDSEVGLQPASIGGARKIKRSKKKVSKRNKYSKKKRYSKKKKYSNKNRYSKKKKYSKRLKNKRR